MDVDLLKPYGYSTSLNYLVLFFLSPAPLRYFLVAAESWTLSVPSVISGGDGSDGEVWSFGAEGLEDFVTGFL
jgi:hypothetical protein